MHLLSHVLFSFFTGLSLWWSSFVPVDNDTIPKSEGALWREVLGSLNVHMEKNCPANLDNRHQNCYMSGKWMFLFFKPFSFWVSLLQLPTFPPTNTITVSKVLLLFAFLFMDINMAETLISVFTWGIYIGFVCGQTKLSLSDTQQCLSANLYQTVWKYPSIKIRWRHCHHWVQSSSRWKLRVHNLFKEQEDVQHGRGLSTIQDGPREICKKQII